MTAKKFLIRAIIVMIPLTPISAKASLPHQNNVAKAKTAVFKKHVNNFSASKKVPLLTFEPPGEPTGYYNAASGLTCAALKSALFSIISTGTTQLTYTPGLWNAYPQTDKKRNDANTADVVWDMYSDNPSGADPYTFTFVTNQCGNYSKEGDCFNREHTFPQSWFGNGVYPMYSDINFVVPTDGYVNGVRGDNPYGETSAPTKTTLNGSKIGPCTYPGFTKTIFEPIDTYKGDIARIILYVVTRYQSQLPAWKSNANADDILDGTTFPSLDPWVINLFIKWHNQYPVSQKEIDRNNAVYDIQGNRNPFIDHPEYVAAIWQCATPATEISLQNNFIKLYPNPVSNTTINVQMNESIATGVQAQVIDLNGKLITTTTIAAGIKTFSLPAESLSNGRYFVKFVTKKGTTTKSFIVQ
ncbi:MAG: endonuclease [Sphingobacteriales bacterium]|nr:endonuclease [Sphingobacteriales bacterium]MBI3717643.1 endonuclease [Sphingobacteriales bacterium]